MAKIYSLMLYTIQFLPSINNIPRSQSKYIELLGVIGICLYALGFPFSKDICYIGEWMMIGAFLMSLPYIWPKMKSDPIWIGTLVLFAYLVFKGVWTFFIYQEPVLDILDAIRVHLRFFWIFLIAWWVGGSRISLLRVLGFSLIGFIALLITGFDTQMLVAFERGARIDFGINAQTFSLYAATALCGCLFLANDFWGTRYRGFRIFLWIGMIGLCLKLTILSQTRTVWVAFILVLFFYCLSLIYAIKDHRVKIEKRTVLHGIALFLLITLPLAFFNYGPIETRVSRELVTVNKLLTLDIDEIDASSSLGIRIVLWKWSIDMIKQNPLFGWKIEGTSKEYIGKSEGLDDSVTIFNNVHNNYLEILLNQGLIGFFIFLFFPVYVICLIYSRFREKEIPYYFFMTFCSIVILFGVANITVPYITSWRFWPYFSIFYGGFYSLVLWPRVSESEGFV